MSAWPTADDLVYRGLYAGVSEVACLTRTTRQNVSGKMIHLPWFPTPQGYIYPERRRWPYWFLRDVRVELERRDMLRDGLPVSEDIEDWEYDYRGELVTAREFAQIGGFRDSNVHPVARGRAPVRHADVLRMGTVWREDEVRKILEASGFPKRKGGWR